MIAKIDSCLQYKSIEDNRKLKKEKSCTRFFNYTLFKRKGRVFMSENKNELGRKLGLSAVIALGVGTTVGSGIFHLYLR